MSLVELIVALTILGGTLLSLASFSIRFAQTASKSQARSTAVELAVDRIEAIKSYDNYDALDSVFTATETSIAGFPEYTRQTVLTRVGGVAPDTLEDYTAVTVIVSSRLLSEPEKKTTFIAAY
jgi:Tfp pilus assembly protein PilV